MQDMKEAMDIAPLPASAKALAMQIQRQTAALEHMEARARR